MGEHGRAPDQPGTSTAILELVCRRCIAELGASEASVVLASSDGLWTPAYSTGPVAADLEQRAFVFGEGPCYEALRDHSPVLVADLDRREAQSRWPAWSAAARAAGIRSVSAFPIQAGAVAGGALTVFSAEINLLRRDQLALALRLADTALLGLLDILAGLDHVDGAAHPGEPSVARLAEIADIVRAEVHQAAGMIMVQADLPIMAALARLRARAYRTGRPITDVARDVLSRRIRFSADGDSAE